MQRSVPVVVIRCAVFLSALFVTACGGAQQSVPLPSAQPPGDASGGAALRRVTVVVKLPSRSNAAAALRRATAVRPQSARRLHPLFIVPQIESITLSVSAPGSPSTSVTSNVVCAPAAPPATAPSCTLTATVLAPVQKQDTFTIVAYDGADASGNELSTGSTVYPVSAGQQLQIPVVLNGTVASIVAVTVGNPNPVTGSSASSPVSVTAADADGNVIVGRYGAPITLQLFENDSEGLLSFVQGGFVQTTAPLAASTSTATVYLKAKADVTTPDDATLVASLPNAPFVPGTSGTPPLASLAEITTLCPASSPACVFYPSGYQAIATATVSSAGVSTWSQPFVVPGTVADPAPGNSIWSLLGSLGEINVFNTATDTFGVAATTASVPSNTISAVSDIGGSFWAVTDDVNTGDADVATFSTAGGAPTIYSTAESSFAGQDTAIASSFDAYGKIWALSNGGLFAVAPAGGASYLCNFDPTDVNFQSAAVTALAVAGSTVWIGVSGASDGNVYVFKVPAQVPASGCDLTALEQPATQFELTEQIAALDVTSIAIDAAGDAYALQLTAVTKITPAGVALKLVDTGLSAAQSFVGIVLDGATMYLVDFQTGSGVPPYAGTGTLDRASTVTPTASPLTAFMLPSVLDLPNAPGMPSPLLYQPFFTPDGNLWIGPAPFSNPALPFNLLGSANSEAGGLVRIDVAAAQFAAAKIRAGRADPARLLRMQRERRLHHFGRRKRQPF